MLTLSDLWVYLEKKNSAVGKQRVPLQESTGVYPSGKMEGAIQKIT